MSDTDGRPSDPDWYDIDFGRDERDRFLKRYQPTAMELICVGDNVITVDGIEAVVEEKFPDLNLISVRNEDGMLTGLFAPEEVVVVAEEEMSSDTD